MFIPFGSRILPPSWALSISRFSVAYPRGVIFFTPSHVSFSPDIFLLSFSLLLFSLFSVSLRIISFYFASELSPPLDVFSTCARFKHPCTIGQAARITRKATVLRANITSDVPWESQFILSSYSWSLSFILINWLSCFSSRCLVGTLELIVSLYTFRRCF